MFNLQPSNTKDKNLHQKPPTGSSGSHLLRGSQQVWLPGFTPLCNFAALHSLEDNFAGIQDFKVVELYQD